MPGPSIVFDALRSDFLAGVDGDCTLSFVNNDEVALKKKCESVVLKPVKYFHAAQNFAEGQSKEFKIDITDFYVGCTISVEQFVNTALLAMLDGDVKLEKPEEFSLADRFGIVRFRGYLGLPYDVVLTSKFILTDSNREDSLQHVRRMLESGDEHMIELTIKHHVEIFRNASASKFDAEWADVYRLFQLLRDSKKERAAKVFALLHRKFQAYIGPCACLEAQLKTPHEMYTLCNRLTGGITGSLIETLKLQQDYIGDGQSRWTHAKIILEHGQFYLFFSLKIADKGNNRQYPDAGHLPYLDSDDFATCTSLLDFSFQSKMLDIIQNIVTEKLMSALLPPVPRPTPFKHDSQSFRYSHSYAKHISGLSSVYLEAIQAKRNDLLERIILLQSAEPTNG